MQGLSTMCLMADIPVEEEMHDDCIPLGGYSSFNVGGV